MTSLYRVSGSIDWVTLDGGVVVMDSTEHLHLLTGTGAEIWSLIPSTPHALELIRAVSRHYPDSERVEEDVSRFLSDLVGKGLLEEVTEGAEPSFSAPSHLAWTDDGDTLVLANLKTGARRTLSSTASRIWHLLSEGHSPSDVAYFLSSEYANVPDHLPDEIGRVVDQLVAEGCLQPVSTRPPT